MILLNFHMPSKLPFKSTSFRSGGDEFAPPGERIEIHVSLRVFEEARE